MAIHIRSGDLLTEPSEAVVNTVNCVGVMGKGIAEQFKKKWPANYRAYKKVCDKKSLSPGSMFIFDLGGIGGGPKYIVNFPTKLHWRQPSKVEYIEEGLRELVKQIQILNIRSIALPPLGCGNGGLKWEAIKPIIQNAFESLPDVEVTLFAPSDAEVTPKTATPTKRPPMTPSRAAVLLVFSVYKQMQYTLGRIEAHKLAYFLQESGEPLKLNFEPHTYGPYSETLKHVLTRMDGHFLHYVDNNPATNEIIVDKKSLIEAQEITNTKASTALKKRVERVSRLINGFETPLGMELLATVLWVMKKDGLTKFDDVVSAVHAWSERKKTVLKVDDLRLAWQRIRRNRWA